MAKGRRIAVGNRDELWNIIKFLAASNHLDAVHEALKSANIEEVRITAEVVETFRNFLEELPQEQQPMGWKGSCKCTIEAD